MRLVHAQAAAVAGAAAAGRPASTWLACFMLSSKSLSAPILSPVTYFRFASRSVSSACRSVGRDAAVARRPAAKHHHKGVAWSSEL